jgi:hypothetical protein
VFVIKIALVIEGFILLPPALVEVEYAILLSKPRLNVVSTKPTGAARFTSLYRMLLIVLE